MKILITGSNGQLGSELTKILREGRSEIGPIPEVMINAQLDSIDLDDLDITDINASSLYITAASPDIIINCAAYTDVDACEANREDAFRVNAIGARNMAICAEKIGAKLVHLSTDYVFAGDAERPYSEFDLPAPKSVYGLTKLAGEDYVRQFSTRWFIVRTAWLYGLSGRNFVKTILKRASETGKLKVVDDQIGNPTNAADLAHHILKIAAAGEYGLCHCTGKGECSWYEFAKKIVEYSGIEAMVEPCTSDEYPRPAKRPSYSSLDHMMLRSTVGDEMRSWQEALRSFLKLYKGE